MVSFIKKGLLALIFTFSIQISFAGEGMWIPMLLQMLEGQMQEMGMKMTAEDVYSINKSSLKDAIVHFGGGCTGEIISPNGLLLTNHHCGRGRIQSHSTLEHNYLEDGFWARGQRQELANDGLTATFLSRMEEVTQAVLSGVEENMTSEDREAKIKSNIAALEKNIEKEAHEDVVIRPFFHGNQYYALISVTYRDVRLVGAPPSSIGSFGEDTDNWVWPRHSGDFSLFRVYAGKDNLPADYSEENVPLKPKHFLPISLDGVEEDDFTLVFGYPGSTDEYLPSPAVAQIMNVVDPARIAIRDRSLNVINAAMRADAEVKILYTSKQARIANAWKKWQGEVQGLQASDAVGKKKKQEMLFKKALAKEPRWSKKYGDILNDFETLYAKNEPYALANATYVEVLLVNIELFRMARQFTRLVGAFEEGDDESFEAVKTRLKNNLRGTYKGYRPAIDEGVFASVMEYFVKSLDDEFVPDYLEQLVNENNSDFETLAKKVYSESILTNWESISNILEMPNSDVVKALQNDVGFKLNSALTDTYRSNIAPEHDELSAKISDLQRTYMKALIEVFPRRKFYPDANSTLRVSFGKVEGYQPRDAVSYDHITYLDGVMEKYIPGDYEYDVPEKLRELYEKKDYGQYGENGKMPVCFIGSNHTTGGNSGSPAIDAHGNLIGLNFDRAWEGTMSDINYDRSICRNIMVDARYVLFIIEKLGGAKHLIDEMVLVHPKSKKPSKIRLQERAPESKQIDGRDLKKKILKPKGHQ